MTRRGAGVLIAIAVSIGACKGKAPSGTASTQAERSDDDEPSAASAPSERPPTQRWEGVDLVDDGYRLRIHPPDETYVVSNRIDAAELGREVTATVLDSAANVLYVSVTEIPDVDVAAFATSVALQQRSGGALVDPVADVPFEGLSAKRISSLFGSQRTCDILFSRERFLYTLRVEMNAALGQTVTCDAATRLFATVKLEPGSITGWTPGPRPRDRVESSFRIHDGIYESSVSGVRLPIPNDCEILPKAATDGGYLGADIVITHSHPEWEIIVRSDAWRSVPDRALVIEQYRQSLAQSFGATILPETKTWTLFGKAEKVTKSVSQLREYENAIVIEADRGINLTAFASHGNAKTSFEQIERVLQAMTRMSEGERVALAKDLERVEPTLAKLDAWTTLRGSKYTHHGAGVELTLPRGPWAWAAGGDAAPGQTLPAGYSLLRGTQRETGLSIAIVAMPAPNMEASLAHTTALAAYGPKAPFGPVTTGTLASQPASISEAKVDQTAYRAISVLRGGFLYVLSMSAPSTTGFSELEAGFRAIEPQKSFFEVQGGRFVDLGAGIAVPLDPSWQALPLVEGPGRGVGASSGAAAFEVYSVPRQPSLLKERVAQIVIAELLRKRGVAVEVSVPKAEDATLAGGPARKFTYRVGGGTATADALLATRDDLTYIVVAQGPGTLEQIVAKTTIASR